MKRIISVLLALALFLTTLAFTTPSSVSAATKVFTEKKTSIAVDTVSNTNGYGIIRRVEGDTTMQGLVDCSGKIIFDFDSEYATWGGYLVMDNGIVKVGDTSHSLFYNIATQEYFDVTDWVKDIAADMDWFHKYVNADAEKVLDCKINKCYAGKSTITASCIFSYYSNSEWYEGEAEEWCDVIFDADGAKEKAFTNTYDQGWCSFASNDAGYYSPDTSYSYYLDYLTKTRIFTFNTDRESYSYVDSPKICDSDYNWTCWALSDGYAKIRDDGKPWYYACDESPTKGLYGYLDKNGDIVIEPQYESANTFTDGCAGVKKNGKWGYIDAINKVVIPFKYDSAFGGDGNYFAVGKGEKYGLVNSKNKVVVDLKYSDISNYGYGVAYAVKSGKLYILTPKEATGSAMGEVTINSFKFKSNGNPTLKWKKVKKATGYTIYRKTASDANWVKVGSTTKTSYTDKKISVPILSYVQYKVQPYIKAADGTVTRGRYSDSVSAPRYYSTYPVEVNEKTIPDKGFREYIINKFGDSISEDEAVSMTYLSFYYEDYTSLKGIEYFPFLKWIFLYDVPVKEVDISKNPFLIEGNVESNADIKIIK